MTAFGKFIRGRGYGARCDGCGRISSDADGYYFDKKLQRSGRISSKGRECRHDFCNECEKSNPEPPACLLCEKDNNDHETNS